MSNASWSPRRDEQAVGVVFRVIKIKGIAQADIEPQRVELRDRPDRIHVYLRTKDDIFLGMHIGEIDVVVVLNAEGRAKTKANRTGEKIVWNMFDRLAPRLGRSFAGE